MSVESEPLVFMWYIKDYQVRKSLQLLLLYLLTFLMRGIRVLIMESLDTAIDTFLNFIMCYKLRGLVRGKVTSYSREPSVAGSLD